MVEARKAYSLEFEIVEENIIDELMKEESVTESIEDKETGKIEDIKTAEEIDPVERAEDVKKSEPVQKTEEVKETEKVKESELFEEIDQVIETLIDPIEEKEPVYET